MAESWAEVLDRLESDLDAAERHLADPSAAPVRPWAVPVGLGPLPAELADRAVAIGARQELLAPRVEEARAAAGRRLVAVRRAPATGASRGAVYVDTKA